jgi:hypothetical protein
MLPGTSVSYSQKNPRRLLTMKRLTVVFAIFITAFIFGCAGMEKAFSVKYQVSGTSTNVDISYIDSTGANAYTTQSVFPWKDEQTRTTPFDVSLATVVNGSVGTIKAEIYVGGVLYKEANGTTGTAVISGTINKDH